MKKVTAVEWLFEQMPKKLHSHYKKQLEQAKAMDEKNIKDSFVAGAGMGEMFNNENRCYVTDAEQYLKETFKSK